MNSGSSQDFLSAIKSDGNFKDLESPRIFIGNVASEPPQESSRILASPMGFVDSSPFNLGTPKNNFISPYIPRGEISSFVDASPSLTASLPKYVDPSKYTKSTSSLRSLPVKEEGISSKYVADLKDYNQNFALRANSLTSRNLMSGPRNAKQENNESMMYDYDNIEMFESTIKQEDDGDTALLSIKTENLQNYGFDEKNSTTIKQEISDSDSTSEFRTLSTNGESKGDKNDSSSLNDRKDSNRTVVACVVCHRAKARCDSGRPCSRCVRLGRSEECLDRPHKKRSRSSKRAASIVANATAAAVAEFGREGYLGILMGEYSPSRFKKYSSILSSIWFESCKNALQKCSESSDFVRYYNEARKM